MRLLVGTSGFSYAEWKGTFYPEGLAEAEMLSCYAKRLPTVEINSTFYRMPQPALLEGWQQKVPTSDFRFALKAPRTITHVNRLKGAESATEHFLRVAATLGEGLGPILFQLPPFLRKDAGILREFLGALPAGVKAAFEFRHASWFDDEITRLLEERGAALVAGDPDEGEPLPLIATARFGYLRLRAPSYDAAALTHWQQQITAQPWDEAYVYLKHEVLGPGYALALQQIFRGEAPLIPSAPPGARAVPYAGAKKAAAKAPRKAAKAKAKEARNKAASSTAEHAPKPRKIKK